MDMVLSATTARCDQGVDEAISSIEMQLPGKGIWITEWSGYAWARADASNQAFPVFGLYVHLTTRMLMTFLRHPSVTMTEYHMLNFSGGPMSLYRHDPQSHSYMPISSAIILKWFNQAANGGAAYQRLNVDGAQWVNSSVTAEEGYYDIEAIQSHKGNTVTIIIHNCSSETRIVSSASIVSERLPAVIESALVNSTTDYSSTVPAVNALPLAYQIQIPAYSVTRIVWG